jgi:pyruvate dehydrogenase E1 component alpha subunit
MKWQNFFRVNPEDVEKIFDKSLLSDSEKLDDEKITQAYKQMVLLRKFEERCSDLYMKGHIAGFCHLYIGQEAIATGNVFSSQKGDAFITSYRDHGLMLACGSSALGIMGELCGKEIGCSKGKGGSMHIFDTEKRFYGGHGIVGAQTSLGTGLAFEIKYNKKPNISYTYLGDGAVHQGQFFESMNMASLWNLPVIYVIENNNYAMGTSIERSTYDTNLFNRGLPFGILGKQVNGMDFFETYEAFMLAGKYVRENSRPLILEMKTYRYRGHSMSDPAKYRTKNEVDQYKTLDPIAKIKHYIFEKKILTEESCDEIESEIFAQMNSLAAQCVGAQEPNEKELWTDVYA